MWKLVASVIFELSRNDESWKQKGKRELFDSKSDAET